MNMVGPNQVTIQRFAPVHENRLVPNGNRGNYHYHPQDHHVHYQQQQQYPHVSSHPSAPPCSNHLNNGSFDSSNHGHVHSHSHPSNYHSYPPHSNHPSSHASHPDEAKSNHLTSSMNSMNSSSSNHHHPNPSPPLASRPSHTSTTPTPTPTLVILPPPHEEQMTDIPTPHEHDVLCGRGGSSNRHIGNANFRDLVHVNKALYVTLTKRQKMMVARSIVQAVRSQNPPGRFLQKDAQTGLWYDIGRPRALEKTSQALREKPSPSMCQKEHDKDAGAAGAGNDKDGTGKPADGSSLKEDGEEKKKKKKNVKSSPPSSSCSLNGDEIPPITIPDHLPQFRLPPILPADAASMQPQHPPLPLPPPPLQQRDVRERDGDIREVMAPPAPPHGPPHGPPHHVRSSSNHLPSGPYPSSRHPHPHSKIAASRSFSQPEYDNNAHRGRPDAQDRYGIGSHFSERGETHLPDPPQVLQVPQAKGQAQPPQRNSGGEELRYTNSFVEESYYPPGSSGSGRHSGPAYHLDQSGCGGNADTPYLTNTPPLGPETRAPSHHVPNVNVNMGAPLNHNNGPHYTQRTSVSSHRMSRMEDPAFAPSHSNTGHSHNHRHGRVLPSRSFSPPHPPLRRDGYSYNERGNRTSSQHPHYPHSRSHVPPHPNGEPIRESMSRVHSQESIQAIHPNNRSISHSSSHSNDSHSNNSNSTYITKDYDYHQQMPRLPQVSISSCASMDVTYESHHPSHPQRSHRRVRSHPSMTHSDLPPSFQPPSQLTSNGNHTHSHTLSHAHSHAHSYTHGNTGNPPSSTGYLQRPTQTPSHHPEEYYSNDGSTLSRKRSLDETENHSYHPHPSNYHKAREYSYPQQQQPPHPQPHPQPRPNDSKRHRVLSDPHSHPHRNPMPPHSDHDCHYSLSNSSRSPREQLRKEFDPPCETSQIMHCPEESLDRSYSGGLRPPPPPSMTPTPPLHPEMHMQDKYSAPPPLAHVQDVPTNRYRDSQHHSSVPTTVIPSIPPMEQHSHNSPSRTTTTDTSRMHINDDTTPPSSRNSSSSLESSLEELVEKPSNQTTVTPSSSSMSAGVVTVTDCSSTTSTLSITSSSLHPHAGSGTNSTMNSNVNATTSSSSSTSGDTTEEKDMTTTNTNNHIGGESLLLSGGLAALSKAASLID